MRGTTKFSKRNNMDLDLRELILDETASIMSGDIDNYNQMQRDQQAAERSN